MKTVAVSVLLLCSAMPCRWASASAPSAECQGPVPFCLSQMEAASRPLFSKATVSVGQGVGVPKPACPRGRPVIAVAPETGNGWSRAVAEDFGDGWTVASYVPDGDGWRENPQGKTWAVTGCLDRD